MPVCLDLVLDGGFPPMCGRFTVASDPNEFSDIIQGLKIPAAFQPRYNIAPTQDIPAVLNESNDLLSMVRWGLIPHWAKDLSIGNRMINARAETLAEKSSFKMPLAKQRCLILADGFYEWKKTPGAKTKTPYYFRLKTCKPFGFAGLWARWRNQDGSCLTSATIITTIPNPLVAPVHDRMPVILLPDHYDRWLAREAQEPDGLLHCLVPFPGEQMECYPVSRRVNTPANDDAQCIEPAESGLFPEDHDQQ